MYKFSFVAAAAVSFLGSAVVAEQSTETLSDTRLTAMSVAYDRANADPETKVHVLSPLRVAAMTKAYTSHDVVPDVDGFGHQQWDVVRSAYRSHDAARNETIGFVGN